MSGAIWEWLRWVCLAWVLSLKPTCSVARPLAFDLGSLPCSILTPSVFSAKLQQSKEHFKLYRWVDGTHF